MKTTKIYSFQEAKHLLEKYCIYQDRCHQEVEEKLSKMRLIPEITEVIITYLITENYLNESRFSQSFARGKFRIKKWGRHKIVRAMRLKNISDYNIKLGLKEIDPTDYEQTLDALIEKKIRLTTEENSYKKRKKITDALLRQGYEAELIFQKMAAYFDS